MPPGVTLPSPRTPVPKQKENRNLISSKASSNSLVQQVIGPSETPVIQTEFVDPWTILVSRRIAPVEKGLVVV